MTISTNFLAAPNDHFRLSANRRSTEITVVSRESGSDPWSFDRKFNIRDGSYTANSLVIEIAKALADNNLSDVTFERDPSSRLYQFRSTYTLAKEYAIATSDFLGYESGGEMLGFTSAPAKGIREIGDILPASRPPDLHGTQTITIQASVNAQNNLDPCNLTRKRSVLAVIPAHSGDLNQPGTWDQYVNKEHVLAGICLDVIDLTLQDDMGFPHNPNNHWAISLEIKFKSRDSSTTKTSRHFRDIKKHNAVLRGRSRGME